MIKEKSFFKNLSWIFAGNLAHAIFSFLINIIVARLLSKSDYGIINYAASWVAFFNAIATLGINSVINKYLTEDKKTSNVFMCSAIFARIVSSILSILCCSALIIIMERGESKTIAVTVIQSLSILFAVGDTFVYWFRYRKEANVVEIVRLIAFGIAAIIKLSAILIFNSIYLFTFGIACESLFFSFLLFGVYRKKYDYFLKISKEKIRKMMKSSYPFIFSGILVTVYAQTDKIMLQKMVGSSDVASYSVAITIAGIISVVVNAIIEGFRPEIISTARTDRKIYFRRLRQVYCLTAWLSIAYGIFITLFAKSVLTFLYGTKYLSAASALSLIVWYTSFSYFGSINNIYMVAESKEKWVQINTAVGALSNVVLNFALIPSWGIVGASLASLITQFLANFVTLLIIKDLRPIVPQIFKGILFIDTFPIKTIIQKTSEKR